MRNVLLLASALFVFAASCDERILPPPLDGEGGAGGQTAAAKPAPTAEPECSGVKCSGRWR